MLTMLGHARRSAFVLACAALLATWVIEAVAGAASDGPPTLEPGSYDFIPPTFLDSLTASYLDKGPEKCPPCPQPDCFNCQLPKFTCAQYGDCSEFDGICSCPTGFGGQDCLSPLCGSPVDGYKRFPREGDTCECRDGWTGLNCNVCSSDAGCGEFVLGGDRLGENGTCYDGGLTVRESFSQCDVTNKKITDMLPGRPPKVTFSCDKAASSCNFQFWIGQQESFYCALDQCVETLERSEASNSTLYDCEKVKCSCIPERMLCGEAGSIDISDFLTEEIKGPGTMSCKTGANGVRDCKFEEPGMNGLISSVFGDRAIYLGCTAGECIHYSEVPGYQRPLPPPNSIFWVAFSAASAILIVIVASVTLYILGRHSKDDFGAVRLPEEESAKLMDDHVPAALHFSGLSYTLNEKLILDKISGSVKPGQCMAIAGPSGAGKTTFLDILARRNKRGAISGQVLINGRNMSDADFKRIVGFVDQEDTLMPTLTVYETVLYSALLRLPREMSLEAKKFRTLETLQELGILHIKDSRIGSSEHRSISGGEKRRVSIASELVTSPAIIFADEPTSGLDAANALNVIESLVNLARDYKRTVIFTIHQPRSNIVSLFDHLVLLASGQTIYSGPMDQCVRYFDDIGHPCPPGFNVTDWLMDLCADAARGSEESSPVRNHSRAQSLGGDIPASILGAARTDRGSNAPAEDQTELRTRPNSIVEGGNGEGGGNGSVRLRSRGSRLADGLRNAFARPSLHGRRANAPQLQALVDAYSGSSIAANIRTEIDAFGSTVSDSAAAPVGARGLTAAGEDGEGDLVLRGFKKAGLWTQFTILSGRAFKNLYRNPYLMLANYAMAVVLALFCGLLYHGLTLDIAGFQNRLGLFFFILALFGFSTLTSLGIFANERALFVRERANGYYSPLTYFTSKLMFDILPLRVIPPLIFGGTVYFLVGLIPQVAEFWKFILVLVLFSLAASSAVFFISVALRDPGVANLVGSLTMLFSLLFAGLLINRDKIPYGLRWLQHLSSFHAAYEALIINELRTLSLKETKYGISIDVPAASIISSFGFNSQAFWWPDIATLCIHFGVLTLASLGWLIIFVKERK